MEKTLELWKQFFPNGEPYEEHHINVAQDTDDYHSKLTIDLLENAGDHRLFSYQVSLPHYRDVQFLETAIQSYSTLVHTGNMSSVLYPYNRGFIWRSHMLDPVSYTRDAKRARKKFQISDEEDALNPPLTAMTSQDSASEVNQPVPGAMFRGVPSTLVPKLSDEHIKAMSNNSLQVQMKAIKLENVEGNRYYQFTLGAYSSVFPVAQQLIQQNLHSKGDIWIRTFRDKSSENQFPFDTSMYDTLEIELMETANELFFHDMLDEKDKMPPVERIFYANFKFPDGKMPSIGEECKFNFRMVVKNSCQIGLSRVIPPKDIVGSIKLCICESFSLNTTLRFRQPTYPLHKVFHVKDILRQPQLMAPYSSQLDEEPCYYCDVSITKSFNHSLRCRIVKTDLCNFESVEIIDWDDNLISSSHLIGRESLPCMEQIAAPHLSCILKKKMEQVHLIRSTNSDWALLKLEREEGRRSASLIKNILLFPLGREGRWITIYSGHAPNDTITLSLDGSTLLVDLRKLKLVITPVPSDAFSEFVSLGCTIISALSSFSKEMLILPN